MLLQPRGHCGIGPSKSIADVIAGLASIFKSLPADKLADLADTVTDQTDVWADGDPHRVPDRNVLKIGREETRAAMVLPA